MKEDWFERASARVKKLDRNTGRKVFMVAYVINKKLRKYKEPWSLATIAGIYLSAPTGARYVIILFEDIYLLIDIYGAQIHLKPPFLTLGETTPFPTLDAAVAAAIMGYDSLLGWEFYHSRLEARHNKNFMKQIVNVRKEILKFVSGTDK